MMSSPSPSPAEPDLNPYAPPRAEIVAPAVDLGGNLDADEAIRRAHLGHEAAVKSIGSLHYLGASLGAFGVIGYLVYVLSRGVDAARIDLAEIATLAVYTAGTGLNIALGVGLNRLQTWARWTEVVLVALGLAGSLFGVVADLLFVGIGVAVVYGFILLIQGYILYLLLSPKGSMVFSTEYRAIIERTPHLKYRTSLLVMAALALIIAVVTLMILIVIFTGTMAKV